jgi:hypothetical protein
MFSGVRTFLTLAPGFVVLAAAVVRNCWTQLLIVLQSETVPYLSM